MSEAQELEGGPHDAPPHAEGPPAPEPVDDENLGDKAARSTGWAMLGFGGAQILRFGANLVLTRLLFEEAFGLMALVFVLIQGLDMFSDVGIGPSIIQNERGGEKRFLHTAFTVQAIRGFFVFALASAAAWPASIFYEEPQLLYLVPAAASISFIEGFNSTKLFTLNRNLNLKRLVVLDVGTQGLASGIMIVWAYFHQSVWALMVGMVVGRIVRTILSHLILPGQSDGFDWDKSALKELFSFGRWIFLSTLLTFFTGFADRLIFGKLVPMRVLGIYSIGTSISTLPSYAISHLAQQVNFPLYSRVMEKKAAIGPVYRQVRWPFIVFGGWVLSGLIGGGQAAVDLLYDERYAGAGWVVQMVSVMAWFNILEATNGSVLLAKGKAQYLAASSVAKLIGMCAFIPLGFHYFEFPGAVGGYVASEGFKLAVSAWATSREKAGGRRAEVGLTALGAVSAAVGYWCATWTTDAGFHAALACLAVFLSVTAVWTVVIVPFLLRVKREGNPLRLDI